MSASPLTPEQREAQREAVRRHRARRAEQKAALCGAASTGFERLNRELRRCVFGIHGGRQWGDLREAARALHDLLGPERAARLRDELAFVIAEAPRRERLDREALARFGLAAEGDS